MMNNNFSRILTYIKMSLLCMVAGAAVLYIAGTPLVSYVKAQSSMVIIKGAPAYGNNEFDQLLNPIVNNGKTEEQSEISTPIIDIQYGILRCEQIELTVPLYYGDSDYALQNGAGQNILSGLPGEGRPILVGGHDGTFFEPLKDIETNDIVTIETIGGEYQYQVLETRVADKDDASAYDLLQAKEQLILYTCYPFGQLFGERNKRYCVYCDLISDASDGK